MQSNLMQLKVLLPFKVFVQKEGVKRIVAKTSQGFWGLLPHRLDCIAALTPGILTWESESEGEMVVAVDEGILVKTGLDVLISVRNAIGGTDLAKLHETVKQEFMKVSEQEHDMRLALTKLESGFISRFAELQHA
jgi:F-type H+-transporting ATPase subunit epsilon